MSALHTCLRDYVGYVHEWKYMMRGVCPAVLKFNELRREHHAQIERAVRDGYDVRGLMVWTLIDNFEVQPPFSVQLQHQQYEGFEAFFNLCVILTA